MGRTIILGLWAALLVTACRGQDGQSLKVPGERLARASAVELAKKELECGKVEAKVVAWTSRLDTEEFEVAAHGCGFEVLYEASCARLSCALQQLSPAQPVGELFREP